MNQKEVLWVPHLAEDYNSELEELAVVVEEVEFRRRESVPEVSAYRMKKTELDLRVEGLDLASPTLPLPPPSSTPPSCSP